MGHVLGLLRNEKVQNLIRTPVLAVLVLSSSVAADCLEARARAPWTRLAEPVLIAFAIGLSRGLFTED